MTNNEKSWVKTKLKTTGFVLGFMNVKQVMSYDSYFGKPIL